MARLAQNIPDYYGQTENSVSQGARLGANLGGLYSNATHQGFMQQDQESEILRRNAARKAFGEAWQSGDPAAVDKVMMQFPEFAKQAQEFIGIRDDQHRKDLGSLMAQLNALAGAGDLQGAVNLINRSGRTLDADSTGALKSLLADAMSSDQKTSSAAQQHFAKLTDSLARTALSESERTQYGLSQQQMAQQLQIAEEQISLQRELGGQRNSLGWANLNERAGYHQQMLNLRSQMTDKQQEIADRMNWNAWGGNNKDAIKKLSSTLQAEGRMESALNTGTPIGDVSAMLQFMTQEAPNLSPRISQATGISTESAAGVIQRAQQAIGDLQNGRKLQPQQVKDLRAVSGAMKQAVQNNYYGLVSPALVGVDLSDPKQAQSAMKRTNLPLSALQYIQNNSDKYDQYGFGSGIPGSESSEDTVDFKDLKR